jgi:hypothetical protein
MCKGYRREARSEGSTKQMGESMDKNRIQGASTGRAGNVPRSPYPPRGRKSWPRICVAGAAISAFAKRPRFWSLSLVGSGCDCGLPSGVSGKHRGVGERHSSRWEYRESCATWPTAVMDPGILPGAKRSLWGSPMRTSDGLRSLFGAR